MRQTIRSLSVLILALSGLVSVGPAAFAMPPDPPDFSGAQIYQPPPEATGFSLATVLAVAVLAALGTLAVVLLGRWLASHGQRNRPPIVRTS